MGDRVIISNIEFLYEKLFAIDLHNDSKNENYRIFVEKDEFYNMLNSAIEKGDADNGFC